MGRIGAMLREGPVVLRVFWSVLKISGRPFLSASSRASTLKSASRVFDNCHESTYRLYQSMVATRWRAKNMENHASSYSVSVILGAEPTPGDDWANKNNGPYRGTKQPLHLDNGFCSY